MLFHSLTGLGARLGLGLLLGLGSTGLVLAATLARFEADYAGSAVRLAWAVRTETNLTGFSLSRKLPNESSFKPIGSLAPAGRLHYAYLDTSLAQREADLLPGPVEYRLTLRRPGPDYTYTTTVAGPDGPLQRAWSTIKAMFR